MVLFFNLNRMTFSLNLRQKEVRNILADNHHTLSHVLPQAQNRKLNRTTKQHIINQQTHEDAIKASTQDIPQTHAPNKATISRTVLIG